MTEADVMKRARNIVRTLGYESDTHTQTIARALTEYGDQRARETLKSLQDEGWRSRLQIEAIKREARAAAIEAADQKIETEAKHWPATDDVQRVFFAARERVRALLGTKMRAARVPP